MSLGNILLIREGFSPKQQEFFKALVQIIENGAYSVHLHNMIESHRELETLEGNMGEEAGYAWADAWDTLKELNFIIGSLRKAGDDESSKITTQPASGRNCAQIS